MKLIPKDALIAEIEFFIKNKMEELEKMIPGFAKDKIDQIVLKFYERGLRDGVEFGMQEMKQRMMKEAVKTEVCHVFGDEDKAFFPMYGKEMKQGDKVKLIIIKED